MRGFRVSVMYVFLPFMIEEEGRMEISGVDFLLEMSCEWMCGCGFKDAVKLSACFYVRVLVFIHTTYE